MIDTIFGPGGLLEDTDAPWLSQITFKLHQVSPSYPESLPLLILVLMILLPTDARYHSHGIIKVLGFMKLHSP